MNNSMNCYSYSKYHLELLFEIIHLFMIYPVQAAIDDLMNMKNTTVSLLGWETPVYIVLLPGTSSSASAAPLSLVSFWNPRNHMRGSKPSYPR